MKKLATLAAIASLATVAVPTIVIAQGTNQTIAAVDVKTVASGLRSSKVVGSSVMNENKDTIGKIDDLIISKQDKKIYAVIAVGGFLGMGSKLVAVDYDSLQPTSDNSGFVLAGASKDSLKGLPEFKYSD
jgi:hypothetical protein